MSFYKWLNDNPELSEQYEEAKKVRIRLAVERLWRLSECVDDKGCNGRRTAAALIEKALSFQANNYRVGTRPRHKIEHGPKRLPPVLQIVSGRPDKPPAVRSSIDFPQLRAPTLRRGRRLPDGFYR